MWKYLFYTILYLASIECQVAGIWQGLFRPFVYWQYHEYKLLNFTLILAFEEEKFLFIFLFCLSLLVTDGCFNKRAAKIFLFMTSVLLLYLHDISQIKSDVLKYCMCNARINIWCKAVHINRTSCLELDLQSLVNLSYLTCTWSVVS